MMIMRFLNPRAQVSVPPGRFRAGARPLGGRLRSSPRRSQGKKTRGEVVAPDLSAGSSGPLAGTVGRRAGGGAARSHTGARLGDPLTGYGQERGHRGRYLLLDLPILRDDPVRSGQGPSSHHAQQSGKAEKPTWAGAREQLEPAADPYCRRHLAPPAGLLTPEAEATPRRPPSWGGRLWSRRRSPKSAAVTDPSLHSRLR